MRKRKSCDMCLGHCASRVCEEYRVVTCITKSLGGDGGNQNDGRLETADGIKAHAGLKAGCSALNCHFV